MGTTTGFRKFVLIKTRIYENRKPKCGDLGLNFVQDGLKATNARMKTNYFSVKIRAFLRKSAKSA